jgi:hypothetical protein
VNTTVFWDPASLRFELHTEGARVIIPYGPWRLRLDNLDYGVSSYENAEVLLEGEPVSIGEELYLINGNSRIELRNNSTIPLGRELEITGRIRSDTMKNLYFLEILEVEG